MGSRIYLVSSGLALAVRLTAERQHPRSHVDGITSIPTEKHVSEFPQPRRIARNMLNEVFDDRIDDGRTKSIGGAFGAHCAGKEYSKLLNASTKLIQGDACAS